MQKSEDREFVLSIEPNDEEHLFIYTPEAWDAFVDQFNEKTVSSSLTEKQRYLLRHECDTSADSQWRIWIPPYHVEHLHIDHEVTVCFVYLSHPVPLPEEDSTDWSLPIQ